MDTYLVGGAVRDTLLKHPFTEKDWVVIGATPEHMLAQGFKPVGKDFPVFLHPDTAEEYALGRTERKKGSGHTGFECFSSPDVTLEQDLLRRDLTINAMAMDADNKLFDPYGGKADLENKILRHVSEAFIEDPLRVLRVARFYARYKHLGFSVAEQTMDLMRSLANSGELQTLSGERVWQEINKALSTKKPEAFFECLQDCGALAQLMPELHPLTHQQKELVACASKEHDTTTIFAMLFAALPNKQASTLNERIKAPKQFAELAELVASFNTHLAEPSPSANQILELLTGIDAFRKPDRAKAFLRCGELIYPKLRKISFYHEIIDRTINIDSQEFIDAGLTGPAIGKAIANKRLAIIEELSNEHSTD